MPPVISSQAMTSRQWAAFVPQTSGPWAILGHPLIQAFICYARCLEITASRSRDFGDFCFLNLLF